MDKFERFIQIFDLPSQVTEEEVAKTQKLLRLYSTVMRRAAQSIEEMEERCYESRSQSVTDFINLAIDYNGDTDRKRIAERLAEMGHSMQLLSMMEKALMLVKAEPGRGETYYNLLRLRYFDAYCNSNEEVYLTLGISSATYYRNIKPAIRVFAANLWCVVIPDLIISQERQESGDEFPQLHAS